MVPPQTLLAFLCNPELELESRIAKCHIYGRYICVKVLEGWSKKCRKPCIFIKLSVFGAISTNFDEVLSFKPALCDRIFSLFHPEVTIHLNFIQFK